MTPQELLRLGDQVIARLYSEWSETNYCAGWLGSGEVEFVEDILNNDPQREDTLTDYQLDTISEIRKIALAKIAYPDHMK